MLLPVFQDLIKPQWRLVMETLKISGGMPVNELSQVTGASYMAVKQHCEDLRNLGYLERSRIPRTAVGRPEIFYRLAAKADALFPQAGAEFTLDLLEELKFLQGESAPDKLLFQYFERLREKWSPTIPPAAPLGVKATKLVALRNKSGCVSNISVEATGTIRIEEHHNPLQRILDSYPRAIVMEQRMLESILGCRVTRHSPGAENGGQRAVTFDLFSF